MIPENLDESTLMNTILEWKLKNSKTGKYSDKYIAEQIGIKQDYYSYVCQEAVPRQ